MKKIFLFILLTIISCTTQPNASSQSVPEIEPVKNEIPIFNGECKYSLSEALNIIYSIAKDNNLEVKINWVETELFSFDEKCEGRVVGSNLAQGAAIENDSKLELVIAVNKSDTSVELDVIPNEFSKTSGIDLLFKNKLKFNDGFNSISDVDLIQIDKEDFYLLTMTYAGKIVLVDSEFNYLSDFLNLNEKVLSSTSGSESGLINLEIILKENNLYDLFISYVDKNSRLTFEQFKLNENLEVDSSSIIFQGNQNLQPEHYSGSIFNEDNKYFYLSIGDHSITDAWVANSFSPESKILRFSIKETANDILIEPAGIDFNPLYKFKNELEVSSLDSIYLSGFRNPWNFSVIKNLETDSNIYFVGDVGQSRYEEINVIFEDELESSPYFGWPFYEGPFLSPHYNSVSENVLEAHRPPDFYYEHKNNEDGNFRCAVILGGIYESSFDYQNKSFIFTDYCSAELFSIKISSKNVEFYKYEDVNTLNFEGENLNPNIIKTINNKTFLMTINGEIFELIDK